MRKMKAIGQNHLTSMVINTPLSKFLHRIRTQEILSTRITVELWTRLRPHSEVSR